MEDVDKWVESVHSLLVFGLDDDIPAEAEGAEESHAEHLLETKEVLDAYLQKASQFSDQNAALKTRLIELLDAMEREDHVKESSEAMEKLAKYIKLKLKIQHMSLIRAMYHLQRYKSAKEIPSLIFAVRNDVPGVLLNHSRIKKVVLDTVAEVKGPLLVQFHKLLEDHLVAAQKDVSADNTAASSTLWTAFLTQARDSLLAFTMVSLLPTVLTETSGMILEKFQDTLDEALTPTWGRYHYHLQVARTAKSSQQIMWTFDYTRSFVRMMCDLSQALTSSGDLQRLCDLDYATAGQKQVMDKASKFMRAHLAQIVVDFSPMSRELCMQLVEETLDLDEWMHSSALRGISNSSNAGNSSAAVAGKQRFAPLTVCEVLYDAKDMFHQWLQFEHRYFYFELRGKCKDAKKVFSFEFGMETTESNRSDANTKNGGAKAAEGDGLSMTQLRCYQGVYDCMCLFFAACERYQHLPSAAQRVFSVCILEPLLCTALGLLLYRTRSSAVLYQISMGTYKTGKSSSGSSKQPAGAFTAGATEVTSTPKELVEFTDSACYLQSCLGNCARRSLSSHSALQFRSLLWSELQSWMPQILISEEDARKGFSTVDLVDKAWKLPVEYTADGGYAYRNPGSLGSAKAPVFGRGGGGSGKADNKGGSEVCEIGECVDVARGLAITLCGVLKQQLSICK